jgi:hypothetical protein
MKTRFYNVPTYGLKIVKQGICFKNVEHRDRTNQSGGYGMVMAIKQEKELRSKKAIGKLQGSLLHNP